MIELFENVRIKNKDLIGTVVDITNINGKIIYTIESNTSGYTNDSDAYNGLFPLYQCTADELENLNNNK